MKRKPLVIGIAGGTGSGKTTIANKIKEHFHNKAVFIAHDNIFVEPTKKYADIIIPEGRNNKVAISIVIHAIERLRK